MIKGTRHTLKSRKKISKSQPIQLRVGDKNHNWKGGVSKDKTHLKDSDKAYHKRKRETQASRPRPEQCELCGIFRKDLKRALCFDHDHTTGKFRGWICVRCNVALGMVKDNSELLLRMSEYVNK